MSAAKLPLIVAHRGASYKAPENTITSFELAFSEGADFIEGDFWYTKDKEIVCIHDSDTARVTGGSKKLIVNKSTLEELKVLDVGKWKGNEFKNTRIPALEEVLSIIPIEKGIFIEIKEEEPFFVDSLIKKIKTSKIPLQNIRLIAFNPSTVSYAKKSYPGIKAYWLFDWYPINKTGSNENILKELVETLKKLRCDGIDIDAACKIDEQFSNALQDHNFEFCAYNADDTDVAGGLMKLGVSALTVDNPKKIITHLKKII